MFHVSDWLYFERICDGPDFGGVRILKRAAPYTESSPIEFSQYLTADEWASVVASMTVLGESGALSRAIVALQKGQ